MAMAMPMAVAMALAMPMALVTVGCVALVTVGCVVSFKWDLHEIRVISPDKISKLVNIEYVVYDDDDDDDGDDDDDVAMARPGSDYDSPDSSHSSYHHCNMY